MALHDTLEIEQGASNIIPFTVTRDGDPVDLDAVGVDILCTFRARRDATSQVLYSASKTGGGIVVTGLGAGEVRMSPAESRAMRNDAEGDIDILLSETDRPRFWSGSVRLARTVHAS